MKRIGGILAWLLAFALLTTALVAVQRATHRPSTPIDPQPVSLDNPNCTQYTLDLTYNEAQHTLSGTQQIDYLNTSQDQLSELVLQLMPNAYAQNSYLPFDASDTDIYPFGFSAGGLAVLSLLVDGQEATFYVEGDQQTVMRILLPDPLLPGMGATLEMDTLTTLPYATTPMGYSHGTLRLTDFYPRVAAYDDGEFLAYGYPLVGDGRASETGDYKVSLTVPDRYTLIAPGQVTLTKTENGVAQYAITAPGLRQLSLTLAEGYSLKSREVNGVVVNVYARSLRGADQALQYAADALTVYGERYGQYPYATYSMLFTPLCREAYVDTQLCWLDERMLRENRTFDMEVQVARATAGQWFYSLTGSDNFLRGWMTVGLSEYAAMTYWSQLHPGEEDYFINTLVLTDYENVGNSAYLAIESAADEWGNEMDYHAAARAKTVFMLLDIRDIVGQDVLDKGLHNYAVNTRYAFAHPIALRDAINQASGGSIGKIMEDWLTGQDSL